MKKGQMEPRLAVCLWKLRQFSSGKEKSPKTSRLVEESYNTSALVMK